MTATLALTRTGDLNSRQGTSTILVRSADELRRALRAARERAVTLDISGLNRMLRLDRQRRLVEVQAAAPWAEVAAATGESGLATRLSGSVGEAVSTNASAPDGSPMVTHVEAVTLVTPDGEVQRADRRAHSDLFALAIGGFDLVGVLYSVTLRTDSLARSLECGEEPVVLDLAEPQREAGSARSAEFLVAPENLDSILAGFKRVVAERRIRLQRITVRRLRPERESFLCWATREWAQVRLEYSMRDTLGACAHAAEIERLLLDLALAGGGSFRIGASQHASLGQLHRCYPMLGDFIAQKKRLDPAERLQNAWYRRVTAQMRAL